MSVLRNQTHDKFTIITNDLIENTQISHAAFRVACYLLSKPNDWQINNTDIQKRLGIKETKTLSGYWKELMKAGILFRKAKPKFKGRFQGFDYAIGACPEDWKREDFTVGGSTTNGSAVNGETTQHSNTDITKTDSTNTNITLSGNNLTGTTCGSTQQQHQEKPRQKQKKVRHLKTSQVDHEEYSHTYNVMWELQNILNEHTDKGGNNGHYFMMSGDGELVVNPEHLDAIETNLAELIEVDGDIDSENHELDVAWKLAKFYNLRCHYEKRPTNLAFLAGVNMIGESGDEIEPWEWVGMVRSAVTEWELR